MTDSENTWNREAELALLESAKAGDHRAFTELIKGAQRRMWAVAWSITGNQPDAEDAMQDALSAIWRNLHRFEPRARFSTWAYRIASNAALQIVRARREILDPDAGLTEASTDSPVDSQVSSTMVVREALAGLPEDFREALVLREYGGLSYQEVAEQQGVPVQTVKSRINRARGRLKESLLAAGVDHA
ncbi:RNA polymerase sigma factor [Corynebacterium sp. A21]|uniref:RNA polymerase sigma factor n=1 Tax=Corynebacterium sp. A21 TaxID=3457318 RepID=UPI003FD68402